MTLTTVRTDRDWSSRNELATCSSRHQRSGKPQPSPYTVSATLRATMPTRVTRPRVRRADATSTSTRRAANDARRQLHAAPPVERVERIRQKQREDRDQRQVIARCREHQRMDDRKVHD